jgi:hypothetical protein
VRINQARRNDASGAIDSIGVTVFARDLVLWTDRSDRIVFNRDRGILEYRRVSRLSSSSRARRAGTCHDLRGVDE